MNPPTFSVKLRNRFSVSLLLIAVLYALVAERVRAETEADAPQLQADAGRGVRIRLCDQVLLESPPEGLWSVATDWTNGWPAGWIHAQPAKVWDEGEWTRVCGQVELGQGRLELSDSYRKEGDVVHAVRRFSWRGQADLPRCTLSVRWLSPGATNAKPLLPGIVYFAAMGVDLDRVGASVATGGAPAKVTPAPLYRDPVFDGPADPVLVWNPRRQAWWMCYTQRRAKLSLPGVAWAHGTEIGVAESRDGGMTWDYVGQLPLWHPDPGYSFWAPDVILDDDGTYHFFVTYVPGDGDKHVTWDGPRFIFQYTSKDLWNWEYARKVPTASDRCIDPSLCRLPNGAWRMWYKDEGHNSETLALESRDLKEWRGVKDPGVSQRYGEGPKVFQFQGYYWLIKDPGSGLDVYRSADLDNWTYQGKILEKPGRRNDDAAMGQHADVVVSGARAYIIYFTHPYGQDFPAKDRVMPLAARRSSLQAAELEVQDGKLLCDRDKPFSIQLLPPGESEP